jgi:hypothetical protein
MAPETRHVRRLQLLLHDTCRTSEAREAAKHAAHELGLQLSGEGAASLSARVPDAEFRKLFCGAAADALTVPDPLKPYVSSICEAPEHLSFE